MHISRFSSFTLNENDKSHCKLYHGLKGHNEFKEFNFETFPYFYLTPNEGYAGTYGDVQSFDVDTTGFLDLTKFGIKPMDFKTTQVEFYKQTKLYFPPDLANNKSAKYAFWERLRMDTNGILKKRLMAVGIHGIIMKEEANRTIGGGSREYTVYVLFDNTVLR